MRLRILSRCDDEAAGDHVRVIFQCLNLLKAYNTLPSRSLSKISLGCPARLQDGWLANQKVSRLCLKINITYIAQGNMFINSSQLDDRPIGYTVCTYPLELVPGSVWPTRQIPGGDPCRPYCKDFVRTTCRLGFCPMFILRVLHKEY
jgi:hypothetical protein